MMQIQNHRARIRHYHTDTALLDLHLLPDSHIVQTDRLPLLQLPVVTPPIPRDPRDGITTVRREPLHADLGDAGRDVERIRLARARHGVADGRRPVDGVIVLAQVQHRDALQLAVLVRGIRALELVRQRQVRDLHGVAGQVAEHGGDGDVAVVGGLGADGGLIRVDGLPGGVAVVRALVHVGALDAVGGSPEVEVDAPEGGAEGVGEARGAFVVEGVVLAEDEGDAGVGEVVADGEDLGEGFDGGGVVH